MRAELYGATLSVRLDDDASLGAVRLVRYDGWLLVIGDEYVLGGIDLAKKKVYGEYQWDALPFTQWSGEGKLLREENLSEAGQAGLPAGYKLRRLEAPGSSEPRSRPAGARGPETPGS